MKNITKYHATLFNSFIHNKFNMNVINKIIDISNIISSLGILLIPMNRRNRDIDKYMIAGLCIFNFI